MVSEPAVTFAVVAVGMLITHQVADHWVQTTAQATRKGLPGWPGRLACARHVASYTAMTAVGVGVLWWALRLGIHPVGFLAGQVVSAGSHYWADRRFTLQRLADRVGLGEFYRLGQPRRELQAVTDDGNHIVELEWTRVDRPGWDPLEGGVDAPWDNPTLGTGAYAMDQSWHWAFLGAAAFLTAVIP